MTRGDWLGLLAGCIVGTVVGVMASGVSFAAPNYAGMPQTRGRGGGGLAAGSPVVAPSGTFGSIDAGFITINAPTGAECALGIKAVDNYRAICMDKGGGLSASFPVLAYNAGTQVLNFSSPGNITMSPGTSVTVNGNTITTGTTSLGTGSTAISMSPRGTATLDFASISANTCGTDATITVTGATAGAEVELGVPNAAMVAGSQFTGWVSATNTVSVRHCCNGSAGCDPGSGTFSARSFNP